MKIVLTLVAVRCPVVCPVTMCDRWLSVLFCSALLKLNHQVWAFFKVNHRPQLLVQTSHLINSPSCLKITTHTYIQSQFQIRLHSPLFPSANTVNRYLPTNTTEQSKTPGPISPGGKKVSIGHSTLRESVTPSLPGPIGPGGKRALSLPGPIGPGGKSEYVQWWFSYTIRSGSVT
jgi:hypothetical protein